MKKMIFLFLLNACLLGSCTNLPTAIPTTTGTLDSSIEINTSTLTSTPNATHVIPNRTLAATSDLNYVQHCLQIEKGTPEDVVLQGRIVTKANDSNKLVVFPPDEYFSDELSNIYGNAVLGISPDRQWLVYKLDDTPENFITIAGFSSITDTRWTTQIPAIARDISHWAYWLDDERLVFNIYLENPIVVNMFTGKTEYVDIRYPDFYLDDRHTPLFSRDLNRMIAYQSIPEDPPSIVLWDLPSKSELWRIYIDTEVTFRKLTQISPNGEQIAVSGSPDYFVDPIFLDLFLVNWDGDVMQLTTLRDAGLTTSLIEQIQWSPNGRYIAFWLNESLAVYDTATQMVTDYCVRTSDSMSFHPYWSPNSQQIVFNGDVPPPGSGPIIIVDIVKGSAVEIQDNGYYVEGWMSDTR